MDPSETHHTRGPPPRRHSALIACMAGLRSAHRGGAAAQVLVHERPDRLVVTFARGAARGAAAAAPRSTFQAELFTAAGHFQPAGAVRLTWLGVGAAAGLVGASAGGAAAADVADFGAAVRSTALLSVPILASPPSNMGCGLMNVFVVRRGCAWARAAD